MKKSEMIKKIITSEKWAEIYGDAELKYCEKGINISKLKEIKEIYEDCCGGVL
jgi:hypothetical protein